MTTSFLRYLCRIAIIILFCLLPWLSLADFQFAQGTLFSFKLGVIPFADPAAAIQSFSGFSINSEIFIGASISLLIAFILGRVFCGWICPYGLFSELVVSCYKKDETKIVGKKVRKREHITRGIIFCIAIVAIFVCGFPLLQYISMPGNISLVPLLIKQESGNNIGGIAEIVSVALLIPVIALILEFLTGKRLWCRYVCPQGLLLGLAAALPSRIPFGLRVGWQKDRCICKNGSPCQSACTLKLNPRKLNGPDRMDCFMCGDCIRTCSKYGGALHWNWGNEKHL